MKLEDIRDYKQQLQFKIADAINEFEKETECNVESITKSTIHIKDDLCITEIAVKVTL